MSDIQFGNFRNCGDRLHSVVGQAMSGVNFETKRRRQAGSLPYPVEFCIPVAEASLEMGIAIGSGVQLDHFRTDIGGAADLRRIGPDEQ